MPTFIAVHDHGHCATGVALVSRTHAWPRSPAKELKALGWASCERRANAPAPLSSSLLFGYSTTRCLEEDASNSERPVKSSWPINLRRRKFLRPIVAPSSRAWADDALEKWPSHATFCSRSFPRPFHFFIFRLIVSSSSKRIWNASTQFLDKANFRERGIYMYIRTMVARRRFNYGHHGGSMRMNAARTPSVRAALFFVARSKSTMSMVEGQQWPRAAG